MANGERRRTVTMLVTVKLTMIPITCKHPNISKSPECFHRSSS